jgi:hypothetical protein
MVLTPRIAARSFAGGRRSPGLASLGDREDLKETFRLS